MIRRMLLTISLSAAVGLAWHGWLDTTALDASRVNLKQALAIAAIARGFNGVVSVAQGTEVAVQPVGVGVTLTLGEVLDPINDLIERFSSLALVASVSLAAQRFVGEILANSWLSAALTAAIVVYLALIWLPTPLPRIRQFIGQLVAALLVARFIVAGTLVFTHFIDTQFLAQRQADAMANLTAIGAQAEQIVQTRQSTAEQSPEPQPQGFFSRTFSTTKDQLERLWASSTGTLDVQQRLQTLRIQVEQGVEDIINLIVIFVLQTLVLPISGAWLSWWALQRIWNTLTTQGAETAT